MRIQHNLHFANLDENPVPVLRNRHGNASARFAASQAGALDGSARAGQDERHAHATAAPTGAVHVEFMGINRQAQARQLPFAQRRPMLARAFVEISSALVRGVALAVFSSRTYYMRIPQHGIVFLRLLFAEKIHVLAQSPWFEALLGHTFTTYLEHEDAFPRTWMLSVGAMRLIENGYQRLERQGIIPLDSSLSTFTALLDFSQFLINVLQIGFDAQRAGNAFGAALASRMDMQPTQAAQEALRVIADLRNASPLSTQIQQWKSELVPIQQAQIDETIWERYSQHPNGIVFSSFLQKLFEGFPESYSNTLALQGRQQFAENRLFPVLLAAQNNEQFAHRVFAIADAGLGACTDRPPLTFVDIELETRLHVATQELNNIDGHTPNAEILCCELQKFYKHHATNLLRNHIRTSGVAEDIEAMMFGYELIQKSASRLFPVLPYRKFGSVLDRNLLIQLSETVLQEINDMNYLEAPQPLINHLLDSDSWRNVLQVLTGKNTDQLQQKVIDEIDMQLDYFTDQATDGHITDSQYTTEVLELQKKRENSIADIYNTSECRMWTQNQLENFLGLSV